MERDLSSREIGTDQLSILVPSKARRFNKYSLREENTKSNAWWIDDKETKRREEGLPKSRRTYFQLYDGLRWDIMPLLLKSLEVGQHYG